jgi:hypothetical protein
LIAKKRLRSPSSRASSLRNRGLTSPLDLASKRPAVRRLKAPAS